MYVQDMENAFLKKNNSGTKCNCDENWSGNFCATGPNSPLLFVSGRKSFDDSYKNFTKIEFPFSQTNENTKIRFFRSNSDNSDSYYSYFFEDCLHVGGYLFSRYEFSGTNRNYRLGSDQVTFFLHFFFHND